MISVSAIGTVVTVAEILKNNGLATEKSKNKKFYLQNMRHFKLY